MERLSRFWRENRITLIVVAALVVAFVALHSTPTEIGPTKTFLASLKQGQPSIAFFYSNF